MLSKSPPVVWRSRIYRYRLIGCKCKNCGRVHYPPASACPYCSSRDLEEVELPRVGKVLSYSIVYAVDSDARERSPVILGLIDLGVTRIIAEITDANPEDIKIGSQLEAVFRRIGEDGETGVIIYGLKFRPVI
ncbi:MAG: Zn-ribbon domain-containing OB-fold protein [Acidilobaceae archaeon]